MASISYMTAPIIGLLFFEILHQFASLSLTLTVFFLSSFPFGILCMNFLFVLKISSFLLSKAESESEAIHVCLLLMALLTSCITTSPQSVVKFLSFNPEA